MLTEEIKRWFTERIAQNPEYLASTYLPALEREVKKAESRLREANRKEGIEQIKYAQGWLDGVEKICTVLDGLRISERKTPVEPGLMARIFQRDLSPADNG